MLCFLVLGHNFFFDTAVYLVCDVRLANGSYSFANDRKKKERKKAGVINVNRGFEGNSAASITTRYINGVDSNFAGGGGVLFRAV